MTDLSIGKVISSGKLEVDSCSDPSSCPFIGYLTIPDKTGELEIMYFKEYSIDDTSGQITYHDLDPGDEEYTFDMSYMRIPKEFHYVIVKDDGSVHKEFNHEQSIFGFVLLNIHIHIPSTDTRTNRTPAQRTYLNPKFHYGNPHKDNPDGIVLYGGVRGCRSGAFFGKQLPLFYANRTVKNEITKDKIKKEQYFILTIGTEETIGFCAIDFDNKEQGEIKLKKELNNITAKLAKGEPKPEPGTEKKSYKIGVKLFNYEKYDVDGFENKYGVHIVEKKPEPNAEYEDGWMIDWFEVIPYNQKTNPKGKV